MRTYKDFVLPGDLFLSDIVCHRTYIYALERASRWSVSPRIQDWVERRADEAKAVNQLTPSN